MKALGILIAASVPALLFALGVPPGQAQESVPEKALALWAGYSLTAVTSVSVIPTASPIIPNWPEQQGPLAGEGPRLFFTDLESGPNTGGQDNLGAFLTIWGEGFGATRGSSTVVIGSQEVARYLIGDENNAGARTMDMIVVQLGPNVTSGNIIVTVNGQVSNLLPFTVRAGNIYFVATSGTTANDWVIAKFVLRASNEALEIGGSGSSRWRIVGNDISCPVGDGQTGCITAMSATASTWRR